MPDELIPLFFYFKDFFTLKVGGVTMEDSEFKGRYEQSGLLTVMFEITHKCNWNCSHCYLGDKEPIELETELIYKVLDECKALGVREIVITGGEPTLHKDWRDILKYALQHEFSIQLETINTELKDEDIDLLRKIDEIHLSIDAPPERESVIRPPKYNNDIFKFTEKLRSEGCNPFLFHTLHRENLNYMEELIELANEIGVPIRFNFLLKEGNAATLNDHLFLSKQEIKHVFFKLYEEYRKGRIPRSRVIYQCLVDPEYKEACKNSDRPIIGGCIAGIASCTITPYGDVIPCPHFRKPVGNLRKEELKDIWFDAPLFNKLRDRNNLKDPCGTCGYRSICGGCRAAAYRATGDVCEADPNCFKELL